MRIAGLDLGTKTIGFAVSDALGFTAQGIETIPINIDGSDYGFTRLKQLVKEYEVTHFVVGLPKNMNGSIGERGAFSQLYAEKLEKRFKIPVTLVDERLTTLQSERILMEAGVRRENRKAVIDKMAATIILQTYLDSK